MEPIKPLSSKIKIFMKYYVLISPLTVALIVYLYFYN